LDVSFNLLKYKAILHTMSVNDTSHKLTERERERKRYIAGVTDRFQLVDPLRYQYGVIK
jgi:hypothetical protein